MPLPRLCCGDGEAYCGYHCVIKQGFKFSTLIYFGGGVKCYGAEHFPQAGEPTILCFNHSNGLADAMMVIRTCPRMVRFVAKDTLWKMPVIGQLVANAGAVPIQRRDEYGKDAKVADAFKSITDALNKGECVGVAPEGNSKARTHLDPVGLKPGVAIWAVQAVFQRLDDTSPFAIKLVPCGLVYLHRAFWRSEAMVRYGDAIIVDKDLLRRHGVTSATTDPRDQSRQRCIEEIQSKLKESLSLVSLDVPISQPFPLDDKSQEIEGNWVALRNGIVAGRIYCQVDTASLPLPSWVDIVKHFAQQLERQEQQGLAENIGRYHTALTKLGLHDSQVRNYSYLGHSPSGCTAICTALCSGLLGVLLICVAFCSGGLVLWSPVWAWCRCKTARILVQGRVETEGGVVERRRRNFDMISEGNMTIGFVLLTLECMMAGVIVSYLQGSAWKGLGVGILFLPAILWLTLRLVEEAAALIRHTRRAFALRAAAESKTTDLKQDLLSDCAGSALDKLVRERAVLAQALKALPAPPADQCGHQRTYCGWIWHRTKRDWHESVALHEDLDFLPIHVD